VSQTTAPHRESWLNCNDLVGNGSRLGMARICHHQLKTVARAFQLILPCFTLILNATSSINLYNTYISIDLINECHAEMIKHNGPTLDEAL
jgi:hypothetical protein